MRSRLLAVVVLVAAAACGGDGAPEANPLEGDWRVTLVIGASDFDRAADPTGFPPDGTSFEEPWHFECADDSRCVLTRPEGGAVLGDLGARAGVALELDPSSGAYVGSTTAAAETPVEPDPCTGTPVQQWAVDIDVQPAETGLVGSVVRVPDELRVEVPIEGGEGALCFGLDLTLGLAGVRPRT